MSPRALFTLAFVLWASLYAWSFISFSTAPVTGDGFTRGLDRIMGFIGWQLAAGLVALGIWLSGRMFTRPSAGRWLARLPIVLFGLLIALLVGVFVYANMDASVPPA